MCSTRRLRGRTNADDIELETTLEELALNLRRDAVETDMAVGVNGRLGERRHLGSGWREDWERTCYAARRKTTSSVFQEKKSEDKSGG